MVLLVICVGLSVMMVGFLCLHLYSIESFVTLESKSEESNCGNDKLERKVTVTLE